MGHGIIIECKNCSRTETFMLGVGMGYSSLEKVIGFLESSKEKREVEKILNEHDVKKTDYSNELYVCPDCFQLFGGLHIRIEYDDDLV